MKEREREGDRERERKDDMERKREGVVVVTNNSNIQKKGIQACRECSQITCVTLQTFFSPLHRQRDIHRTITSMC